MNLDLTKFPSITVSKSDSHESLIKSLNLHSCAFSTKDKFLLPKSSSINFSLIENKGELIELIFFGLNYNAKRVRYERKPFVIDLQKSHKIRIDEKRISPIKTKIFKRRMLLFSFDKNKLKSLSNLLQSNRPSNIYSGHGLITRADQYLTKPGKIRQK